ncbi:MAG: response regulator [Halothermotrichaceae bacterium]
MAANILTVDDSAFFRKSIKMFLEKKGMNVYEANDLSLLEKDEFSEDKKIKDMDLILLDVFINGKNGLEVLPFLREEYPTIPVMIVSVDKSEDTILQAFELEANDYIVKPFEKENLLNKIKHYLEIDDEEIANPKQRKLIDEQNEYRDEFNFFKVELLSEIKRSIRSKLPFLIIRVGFVSDNIIKKEKVISLTRSIDHIYTLNRNEYLFLLPYTDNNDVKSFVERITFKLKDYTEINQLTFYNKICFPNNITDEIDKHSSAKYQQEIIDRIG